METSTFSFAPHSWSFSHRCVVIEEELQNYISFVDKKFNSLFFVCVCVGVSALNMMIG